MNIESQFFEYLISVAFAAGVITFLVGVCLLIAPDFVLKTGAKLNRWVSTDAFFNRLDSVKTSEGFIYRHHRLFGSLFLFSAAYIFYIFVFVFDADSQKITLFRSREVNEWLLGTLEFLNIMSSVLIFVIGLVVMFRPSLLKRAESMANKWVSIDRGIKRLDVEMSMPDNIFTTRPRVLGLIIVLGSLYICFNLWSLM